MPFIASMLALLIYPILAYALVKRSMKIPTQKNNLLKFFIILSSLIIVSITFKYSTTFPPLDWILVTIPYLALSYVLWLIVCQSNIFVKIIGILVMVVVFGIGYLFSTVGILGLGAILYEQEPYRRIKLTDCIEYRETKLGHATSDFRGRKFEIYQKIKWLPFMEKRVAYKKVRKLLVNPKDSILPEYNQQEHVIYLKMNKPELYGSRYWKDTLYLSRPHSSTD